MIEEEVGFNLLVIPGLALRYYDTTDLVDIYSRQPITMRYQPFEIDASTIFKFVEVFAITFPIEEKLVLN
jgi:hypothetical protein